MIASLDIEDKPQLSLTTSVLLPGRTLAVIQVNSNLEPEQSGQIYEIEPNCSLSEEYPNLYIVPMMRNIDVIMTLPISGLGKFKYDLPTLCKST